VGASLRARSFWTTSCRKRLYLLCTGTGLAPFLSVTRDPEFTRLREGDPGHGVRYVSDLAYCERLAAGLSEDEFLAGMVRDKLVYYQRHARAYHNRGRISDLMRSGKFFEDMACRR